MEAKGQWCSFKKNTKCFKSIGYKNTPDKSQETPLMIFLDQGALDKKIGPSDSTPC
jgi:hypothetical protein